MPNVQFRASGRTLTSHAGLSVIGQCVDLAGIDSLDGRLPSSRGARASDIVKAYLGLLEPDDELEGWWTRLDATPTAVIQRYQAHATHEQFHSEIKTDLDLERLPSGKFATNDLILPLAQLAYNILRLIGQLGMTGELSPVRHPAKRRRLRTVLQELVHRAALLIHKARQLILDVGQDIGRMTVL